MANDNSKEMLEDAIIKAFDELDQTSVGTEDYSYVLDCVTKLYKLKIDEKKIDLDHKEKCDRREMEGKQFNRDVEFKEKQLNTDATFKEKQLNTEVAFKEKQLNTEVAFKEKQLDTELEFKEKQLDTDATFKEKQLDTESNLKERQIDNDCTAHDEETQIKRDQLIEQVKDRYFKYGVEAGVAVLTLMFYGRFMKKGFKFEETGTYTSSTFKNFISNLKVKFGNR